MKKITMTAAMTLLVGVISGWAQSSATTQNKADKEGSSAVNKASKANNSQLKGTGVPYKKEKEQFGKQMSNKKSGPMPPSSVSSGPGASDAAQGGKTPGSHTAQREMDMGHKTSAKTKKN